MSIFLLRVSISRSSISFLYNFPLQNQNFSHFPSRQSFWSTALQLLSLSIKCIPNSKLSETSKIINARLMKLQNLTWMTDVKMTQMTICKQKQKNWLGCWGRLRWRNCEARPFFCSNKLCILSLFLYLPSILMFWSIFFCSRLRSF